MSSPFQPDASDPTERLNPARNPDIVAIARGLQMSYLDCAIAFLSTSDSVNSAYILRVRQALSAIFHDGTISQP